MNHKCLFLSTIHEGLKDRVFMTFLALCNVAPLPEILRTVNKDLTRSTIIVPWVRCTLACRSVFEHLTLFYLYYVFIDCLFEIKFDLIWFDGRPPSNFTNRTIFTSAYKFNTSSAHRAKIRRCFFLITVHYQDR